MSNIARWEKCPCCGNEIWIRSLEQKAFHCSRCGRTFTVDTKKELTAFEIEKGNLLSYRPLFDEACEMVDKIEEKGGKEDD